MLKRKIEIIMLSAMLSLSLAVCGASNDSCAVDYNYTVMDQKSEMYMDTAGEVAAPEIEMPSTTTTGTTGLSNVNVPEESKKKIVYSCSLELQTLDYESSVNTLRALIEKYSGFVESEMENNREYQ